jgi:tripartite-type tricarboxylate transporter receptor subunit TctC
MPTTRNPFPLLKASVIASMQEIRRVHRLNPRAVRNGKSLGDAVGMTDMGIHLVRIKSGDETTEFHTHYCEEEFLFNSQHRPLVARLPHFTSGRQCFLLKFWPCVAVWAALIMTSALAAEYPTKSIRLIVPSGPGGAPDIQSRLIANELNKTMGQQVIVDNRGGVNGAVGYPMIARAAPDGYTLGYQTFLFITAPVLVLNLPYNPATDFQPVVQQLFGVNLMTVTPALPVRSVQELIAYARAQPGKLSYGGISLGGAQSLSAELFKVMSGTQIVQVSYKAIQQAITDVIAGQVHIVFDDPPSILPHVRAGRVRAFGVTTLKRSPIMPEIPTIAEAGLPGYEMTPSSGYLLPAGTPRDIVVRLNSEINKALKSPTVSEKFTANGTVIAGGTPEHYAEHLKREAAKWAGVIKAAGITPQ